MLPSIQKYCISQANDLLRVVVGLGGDRQKLWFVQHGFAKLSGGPEAFASVLQGMGVPDPHLMAWLQGSCRKRVMTCCVTLWHDLSRDHVSIG